MQSIICAEILPRCKVIPENLVVAHQLWEIVEVHDIVVIGSSKLVDESITVQRFRALLLVPLLWIYRGEFFSYRTTTKFWGMTVSIHYHMCKISDQIIEWKLLLLLLLLLKPAAQAHVRKTKLFINWFRNSISTCATENSRKHNSGKKPTVDRTLKPIQRAGVKHSVGKVILRSNLGRQEIPCNLWRSKPSNFNEWAAVAVWYVELW